MTYFSQWLKNDYADIYNQIVVALETHREQHSLLPHTNDYWCRDYMPIPLPNGNYLQFKYFPDYLRAKIDRQYITDTTKVCNALELQCTETDIILDGGNVIRCGDKVIMVDKILEENEQYNQTELITKLEKLLFAEIVLLPWDKYEKYGHSDGIVRSISDDKVLFTDYRNYDPKMHERFHTILSKYFQVIELNFTKNNSKDDSWAYINFLQTDNVILLPKLNLEKDAEALMQITHCFPKHKIEQIDISKIIERGGALNCLSWNARF